MMSAKSIEQRLLRIEFIVSLLKTEHEKLREEFNAERKSRTATHDASDSTRCETEVEWGTDKGGGS